MELQLTLRKRFGSFTLEMDHRFRGERFGIFGRSGSGKSTLAGLVAGLLQPDSGLIRLDGETLFSSAERINLSPERRRIGIVFQHPTLFPHLTVEGNLRYGLKRCAPVHRTIDFKTIVEILQIGHLLERGVENLSGGEKQRVAIGRAVLANPRLLIMDEPLSALDDTLRFQIIPYLRSVSERFGIPYLFVSHSLIEMRLMTDRVIAVEGGRITDDATADRLARHLMGTSMTGYINILHLGPCRAVDGLHACRWGDGELLISAGCNGEATTFELSSKDIILFKKHPEAISARNLLPCTVVDTFASGTRTGVELAWGSARLVAEVVHQAAAELEIAPGSPVFAAIKASAFRKLY